MHAWSEKRYHHRQNRSHETFIPTGPSQSAFLRGGLPSAVPNRVSCQILVADPRVTRQWRSEEVALLRLATVLTGQTGPVACSSRTDPAKTAPEPKLVLVAVYLTESSLATNERGNTKPRQALRMREGKR
jgi:hypothetical protein